MKHNDFNCELRRSMEKQDTTFNRQLCIQVNYPTISITSATIILNSFDMTSLPTSGTLNSSTPTTNTGSLQLIALQETIIRVGFNFLRRLHGEEWSLSTLKTCRKTTTKRKKSISRCACRSKSLSKLVRLESIRYMREIWRSFPDLYSQQSAQDQSAETSAGFSSGKILL